jgi:hypothetical protein
MCRDCLCGLESKQNSHHHRHGSSPQLPRIVTQPSTTLVSSSVLYEHMDDRMAATITLDTSANRLSLEKSETSLVKPEPVSSPPPSIEDTSGTLEDGEILEQRKDAESIQSKFHAHLYIIG